MKVELIEHTSNPEETVAKAARLCYSDKPTGDIEIKDVGKFVSKLAELGHYSPFEHASFTFAIDGISRACSHQLVRHRLASFSQRSQRYVSEDNFDYIVPESLIGCKDKYEKFMAYTADLYKWLVLNGVPKEDARYILPNATATNIIVTMNARSLLNFFRLRCCNRAQWEIRELADSMYKECMKVAPLLFVNAGPACVTGKCTEGKMTCGKPRANDIFGVNNNV